MKQKTIFCHPDDWEKNYNEWCEQLSKKFKVSISDIFHDNRYHYISYTISSKRMLEDEGC